MITRLEIQYLQPHPQNPRKDLGDLTELAASINEKGILQNLTVVAIDPEMYKSKRAAKKAYTGGYTVIIGHRRLAAAKLAGLEVVPCAVLEMDEKEQLATMLLENMQRSDLTLYEQAQGFQMMLDMGETVESLSKSTGFSESTVRRRVKLLDLDRAGFHKGLARGATLKDYMELDKINDAALKNEVLGHIGTPNFRNRLDWAISKEKAEKQRAEMRAVCASFATEIKEYPRELQRIRYFSPGTDIKVPDDASERKYFYLVEPYGITLYAERTGDEPVPVVDMENERRKERREALDEITKRMYRLRRDFIVDYPFARRYIADIIGFASCVLLLEMVIFHKDAETLDKALGLTQEEAKQDYTIEIIEGAVSVHPERALLLISYFSVDTDRQEYYDWYGAHEENAELDIIYDFLMKLGYEMSDEEKAMQDGTHERLKDNEEQNTDNAVAGTK
jgi:ParB-like partition proteins